MTDPCPWLPTHFEPLEFVNDRRLTREECGANDDGRQTLIPRIREMLQRRGITVPIIIEVGSWAGAHALKLAHAFSGDLAIYCVDTWAGTRRAHSDATTAIAEAIGPDNVFNVFLKNVKDEASINPVRQTSLAAAKEFEDGDADCVFIDADHSYPAVRDDLRAWWPKVMPGGLFCGHDYHLFPGVKKAVDEWVAKIGLPLIVEGECWFVDKPPCP